MIHLMHENHTFTRLDELTVDEAMEKIEAMFTGHGFIGCKSRGETYQWSRATVEWKERVREFLIRNKTSK